MNKSINTNLAVRKLLFNISQLTDMLDPTEWMKEREKMTRAQKGKQGK